ncbi:PREDICTED: uncharacterized protein LOC105454507 [Wasmannia auropunctata]|uniref:uncharacterized protein LOC105454507 n=1 Tax=Wasmannia auropunctata TaxID=64793 RepID=UPI0005F0B476|nr:PREDICTED: uncharacterized protein LOC105454507 [Wasmannia auropunctata]
MEEPTRQEVHAKEKSSVSKNDDGTAQISENALDSSIDLNYDVLRIIFEYLNGRNLASAAMVCKSWLEAANEEKWTRGPCCFKFQQYTQYNNFVYIPSEFIDSIRDIRIKPSAGFFFIPDEVIPTGIKVIVEALLPKNCEIIILGTNNIIIGEKMIHYSSANMVCAFLPQIPNVRVKSFKIPENCIIRKTAEYQEIISTIVNNETSTSNHETCFMLFCNLWGRSRAKRWASTIRERLSKENEIISVWGGVVKDLYAQRAHTGLCKGQKRRFEFFEMHYYYTPRCFAVLITGSVQTWSTILERKCNTKELIEARLKLFKDKVKLKKHSIGFTFMSPQCGADIHDKINEESIAFKRLFPKVPLVGLVGDDEFCGVFGKTTAVDEVNEERNDKKKQNCEKSKSWFNDSTVFLILTYG